MLKYIVKQVFIVKKWLGKMKYSFVAIMLLLFLGGCGSQPANISHELDTSDPTTQKESLYSIDYFFFAESNGSVYNARAVYTLDNEDGIYTATVKPEGVKEEKTLKIKVDNEFVEKLESILADHDIGNWNGYDESSEVTDGVGFVLHVILTDETKIVATGYMEWPEGYSAFADDVHQLFINLYKKNRRRIPWF